MRIKPWESIVLCEKKIKCIKTNKTRMENLQKRSFIKWVKIEVHKSQTDKRTDDKTVT